MMEFIKTLLVLLVFSVIASAYINKGNWNKSKRGALIFSENFNKFDLNVWSHLVTAWRGGNDEFQYYRNNRKNSYVKNGLLHIRPTFVADEVSQQTFYRGNISLPDCTFAPCASSANEEEIVAPIYSARISTNNTFTFKYGIVEVRAKMPRGDWIWPAIWFLPATDRIYGGWPANGEIDLVEVRANQYYTDQNNVSQGVDRFGSTLHYGPRWPFNRWDLAHWERKLHGEDFSDSFHIFELEWTSKDISFRLDGKQMGTISPPEGFWKWGEFDKNPGGDNTWKKGTKMAPFDQEFYMILNVAVGGKFFPDGWLNRGKERPWKWDTPNPMKQFWDARTQWKQTWNRPELLIDYIRVYKIL